jgi:hypothetical protein
MSVSRDMMISWKGEEKQFSPTFRFLRRVDAKLQNDSDRKSNLFTVAKVLNAGGSEILDVPIVMSLFLAEAGFETTEEECWHVVSTVISGHCTMQQRIDYANFALTLTQAVLPDMDFGKNPEAPSESVPKGRGKAASQKSTGQAAI